MARYDGRVVLVTGAARGLGRAMASRFAAEGAIVAVADADGAALADVLIALADSYGDCIGGATVDVTDPQAIGAWVDLTVAQLGRVDVLVSNAGIIRDGLVEHITDAEWLAVVDVSLTGSFYGARAAFPHMKRQGYGRLLNLSSMSWRGNFGQANYVAAKAGIVGFTRAVALEGARHGITANAIAPGLIETPMLASMDDRARAKLIGKIPVGHTGEPADIAAAAAFLCSEEARYITGVVLDIDGGISVGSSIR
jgi:3-oxoacyl-[acyl-carrier protein] reductase